MELNSNERQIKVGVSLDKLKEKTNVIASKGLVLADHLRNATFTGCSDFHGFIKPYQAELDCLISQLKELLTLYEEILGNDHVLREFLSEIHENYISLRLKTDTMRKNLQKGDFEDTYSSLPHGLDEIESKLEGLKLRCNDF